MQMRYTSKAGKYVYLSIICYILSWELETHLEDSELLYRNDWRNLNHLRLCPVSLLEYDLQLSDLLQNEAHILENNIILKPFNFTGRMDAVSRKTEGHQTFINRHTYSIHPACEVEWFRYDFILQEVCFILQMIRKL